MIMKSLLLTLAAALLVVSGCTTRHHVTMDTTHRVDATVRVTVEVDDMIRDAMDWQEDFHEAPEAADPDNDDDD